MLLGSNDRYGGHYCCTKRTRQLAFVTSVSFRSVTTIGYGDYSPQTPTGRGFCIIYCPLAVLVLARTGLQVKRVLQEASLGSLTFSKIKAMDRDKNGHVKKWEYMAAVLIQMGQANEETIELIDLQFRFLDSQNRGECVVCVTGTFPPFLLLC